MSDEPVWMVHVIFTDGSQEEARGDPEVVDGVLHVRVWGSGRDTVLFEAGYPLCHVKWWWVDYGESEGDGMRSGPSR